MVSLASAFVGALAALGATAAPLADLVKRQTTPNAQGTSGGFFYQFWSDGNGGSCEYTNGAAGEFSVTWSSVSDFTSGKGWSTATDRTISYEGSFDPGSNAYLAVYTWSGTGETYILENYADYNPCSGGTDYGTLESDGGSYEICRVDRGGGYIQYWSVRSEKRSSGTVTTKNHYDKYNALGLPFDPSTNATYQILSVEGFGSTGSAKMTVSEGASGSDGNSPPASSGSPAPSSAAPVTPSVAAPPSASSARATSSAVAPLPVSSAAPPSAPAPSLPVTSSFPSSATFSFAPSSAAASSSEPCEASITISATPTPGPSEQCEVDYVTV